MTKEHFLSTSWSLRGLLLDGYFDFGEAVRQGRGTARMLGGVLGSAIQHTMFPS